MAAVLVLAVGTVPASAGQLRPPLCPAAPEQIGFMPALNRPMLLEVVTERAGRGGQRHQFKTEYRIMFARAGRGYRLTATLQQAGRSEKDPKGEVALAMLAPLVGRPVEYLVGADGSGLILQGGEQLWRDIADQVVGRAESAAVAEGRAVAALLRTLPPAERDAMLSADVRQMLRFAGKRWGQDFVGGADHENHDCSQLVLVERDDARHPDSPFVIQRRWHVDLNSGLVSLQSEDQWLRNASGETPELASRTRRSLAILP